MEALEKAGAGRLRIACAAAAVLHTAASFFYETVLFGSFSFQTAEDTLGTAVTYGISKLLGMLLIALFWAQIYRLASGRIPRRARRVFFFSFAAALLLIIPTYPLMYRYEMDNLLVYAGAVRYAPLYWHHYLTSCVYAGSYMFLPHPIILPIVQSAFVCGLFAWLHTGLYARGYKKSAWASLALFAAPATFYLALSPYRNCLYTVLCLYVFVFLLFCMLDRRAIGGRELALLTAGFAVIGAWRTEGLLYLLLLPAALLTFGKKNLLRAALATGACALLSLLLMLPQSRGMRESDGGMGSNYKLVSMMNALQDLFLAAPTLEPGESPAGVPDDVSIVNSFVPLELLREHGLEGYRWYNYSGGRRINVSGKSEAEIAAFSAAYARLVLHSPGVFLRSQLGRFFDAIDLPLTFPAPAYTGPHTEIDKTALYETSRALWAEGGDALAARSYWNLDLTRASGKIHSLAQGAIKKLYPVYEKILTPVMLLVRIAAPFASLAAAILLLKRQRRVFPLLYVLVLLAELAAVVLMAPEGRAAYYYPVGYGLYVSLPVFFAVLKAATARKAS